LNIDHVFRRLALISIALLLVGAIAFFVGSAAYSMFTIVLGVVALIVAFLIRLVLLVRRIFFPPPRRPLSAPSPYNCHVCAYPLRGVAGAFCPECGTVRPAPLKGEGPE